jgi:predicted DNA-binding protein
MTRIVTVSVRLEPELVSELANIAERIGHGATIAGVLRQIIIDRIAKEQK